MSSQPQFKYRLLYVGDDLDVLKLVRDGLKDEGWFVVRWPGNASAVGLLRGRVEYDLMLFEQELSGTSGIELVLLARSLEQRAETPIILLSLADCSTEGRRAGADRVLRKPLHPGALSKAAKRLVGSKG